MERPNLITGTMPNGGGLLEAVPHRTPKEYTDTQEAHDMERYYRNKYETTLELTDVIVLNRRAIN